MLPLAPFVQTAADFHHAAAGDGGMLNGRGEKRGRVHHVAASLYGRLGQTPAYVRSRGFHNQSPVTGSVARDAALAVPGQFVPIARSYLMVIYFPHRGKEVLK